MVSLSTYGKWGFPGPSRREILIEGSMTCHSFPRREQASVKLATKKAESEETDDEDEEAGGRKDSEDDGAGDNRKQGRSRRKPESNAKV